MINFYNWFVCKFFKKCSIDVPGKSLTPFEIYCLENPSAVECRIYDV